MSKILVEVRAETPSTKLVASLRGITGLSMGEIVSRIKNKQILKSYVLYGNDHEDVEYELSRLLHEVPRAGATVRLYEFLYDEDVDPSALESREISPEVLRNMLHGWREEVSRQQELSAAEAEESETGAALDSETDDDYVH